jgi:hypothetical protein
VPGESNRSSSARLSWATGERAARYREQAHRFEALAEMEDRPRARERLLQLAEQYGELAGRVTRQTGQRQFGRAGTGRDQES